jgi:drug/metabolite transporter (DMT)-like permease
MAFPHAGELAALATAGCWTLTALCFEAASRRIGSLAVNLAGLMIAAIFLSIYCWVTRGLLLPVDATGHNWFWLLVSGVVGICIGDFCLFRAFVLIGARRAMLIMSLSLPLTAVAGWLLTGEWLSVLDWTGMTLTVAGVSWVVMERGPRPERESFRKSLLGSGLAFLAASGQAAGLVLSKFGMGDYNPFAATQIRILAALAGFAFLFTLLQRWPGAFRALSDRRAMGLTTTGAFFGTFLGISLSLLAVQLTESGVAATIMSIVPILIIPPSVILFKEEITVRSVLGAFLAVAGVAFLFL